MPARGDPPGIAAFTGIAHRIQFAGEKNGVAFYDDSKGTNVGAVARRSRPSPARSCCSGRPRQGGGLAPVPIIRERVKTLILFGEARERIGASSASRRHRRAATLKAGLEAAREAAAAGDVVLLPRLRELRRVRRLPSAGRHVSALGQGAVDDVQATETDQRPDVLLLVSTLLLVTVGTV